MGITGHTADNKGQALEGKDVKELLLNVGSGGGAAAAPAAGGAAGGEAAAEEAKPEEKEEGKLPQHVLDGFGWQHADVFHSQGGVRRGYGFWSLRLDYDISCAIYKCMHGKGLINAESGGSSSFHIDKQAHEDLRIFDVLIPAVMYLALPREIKPTLCLRGQNRSRTIALNPDISKILRSSQAMLARLLNRESR